jgi:ABC-2 type transport system ATP-binding protein
MKPLQAKRQSVDPIISPIISIEGLTKTYASGFQALKGIDLQVKKGEILALLGPNGAGKTTLISIICGIVNPSEGRVLVDGHDIVRDYRKSRAMIGLVPQELPVDAFETPFAACRYSRGLFGKKPNEAHIEKVLRQLSLWDKRDGMIMALSGGMKRRLLIAKALSHEPRVLFLDEPTAGVDVELRKDMWELVRELKADGVTILLTTHYIEEAEMMADRIGIINHGELVLVEETAALMQKLGRKQMAVELAEPLSELPTGLTNNLADSGLDMSHMELSDDGSKLTYTYDTRGERTGITRLLNGLAAAGVRFNDLSTHQSSLEDIFVSLVKES